MALLVNQLSGFGILTFAKESRAIIDAMTVPPNMARRRLIDLTVRAFLGVGLWPLIDVIWLLGAHDEQAGRINWKDPGNFTCTVVNSVTFTADRGFAGDGVSGHLDTNWHAGTHAVQFTQNNAHIGVYQRTGGSNGNEPFSQNNASARISVAGGTGTSTRSLLNSATQINGASGGSSQPLHGMARRADSSAVSILRDGLQVTSPTAATSTGFGSGNMRFGVRANATFVPHQIFSGHLGAYLDDALALAIYRIQNSYARAIGADT